jgi:hypothetical protein
VRYQAVQVAHVQISFARAEFSNQARLLSASATVRALAAAVSRQLLMLIDPMPVGRLELDGRCFLLRLLLEALLLCMCMLAVSLMSSGCILHGLALGILPHAPVLLNSEIADADGRRV